MALVIGEDDYKTIRTLSNAVADAKSVDDALEKLATAGVDRQANLVAAREAMAALKATGRLPPTFESWVTMVDAALRATSSA